MDGFFRMKAMNGEQQQPQQMHCQDCGTSNTVDSKYCKECGTRINDGYRSLLLSIQDRPADGDPVSEERLAKLLDMAFWHNEAGNADAAVLAAEAALALNPNSTTAHSLLGTLFEKKGDDEKAIEHFEAVLRLNPNSPADAVKLNQLRRGVHVQAVAPPLSHLWLPPAFLKLGPKLRATWENGVAASSEKPLPSRLPFYAAAGVAAAILLIGIVLLRPRAAVPAPVRPVSAAPPTIVSASRSAFGTGNAPAETATSSPAPIVMTSPPSTPEAPPRTPILSANDPFAAPHNAPSSFVPPAPSIYDLPPAAQAHGPRRHPSRDLPPLPLTVRPIPDSEGVAPAPVNVTPLATVADVPVHIVPVTLTRPAADVTSTEGEWHIHITIQQAHDSGTDSVPSTDDGGAPASSAGQGDAAQQRALALQQQGDYKHAIAAYQSAIRAYKSQIAAGRDVETAQRGLDTCQTGLQICQQSQP